VVRSQICEIVLLLNMCIDEAAVTDWPAVVSRPTAQSVTAPAAVQRSVNTRVLAVSISVSAAVFVFLIITVRFCFIRSLLVGSAFCY